MNLEQRIAELELEKFTKAAKYIDLESVCFKQQERILELENSEKHLLQVIYNVAKASFEAGACFTESDFHNEAVEFATKIHSEHTI